MERKNLWAPWRVKYIQGLCDKTTDCFICHDIEHPEEDEENLVLWRTDKSIVVMNRFPYNNGHLLIAPKRHLPNLDETTDEEMLELVKLVRQSQKVLSETINPHGFNVGMNFGRCAGAGLPGHLHVHVVPRWEGDTSFMNVCSDTNVVSQSLADLLVELKRISKEQGLGQP